MEELEAAEASARPPQTETPIAGSVARPTEQRRQMTPDFLFDSEPKETHISSAQYLEAHPNSPSAAPCATYQTPPPTEPRPASFPEPRSFEKLMKPVSRAISRRGDAPLTPVSTDSTSRHPVSAYCTCDSLLSTTKWSLPLRRVADGLVSTYFSRVHRIYPVLHQRTFRKQYQRLWESDADGSTTVGCAGLCRKKNSCKLYAATLQAVFALASLLAPKRPEENATQADTFFRQAQGLDFLDMLDDETGLELVQLGLIMGFYLQGTERFSKCWNITGLTIRLAQNMGMHLPLAEARKRGLVRAHLTQLEYEMRSRVWYGCVILER